MKVTQELHTKVCCMMDDEGFELIFDNKIGRQSHHTRWVHVEYECVVDVWLSKKGITYWNGRDRSIRSKDMDEIRQQIRTYKHNAVETSDFGGTTQNASADSLLR